MNPKVIYINYGIGNRVGNKIYLHKKLKKYPKLHSSILEHEKKHSSGEWEFKDLILDLQNKEVRKVRKDFYKFVFTTPSSWINYSPFIKLGGKLCVDLSLLFFWILVLILGGILIWI